MIALVALVLISAAALWFAPLLGLLATAISLAIVPPWGRSLVERAIISGIVGLGAIAIVFPRAGGTPINHATARLFLIALLVLALALRFTPRLRCAPLPRPTWTDTIVFVTIAIGAWWPISAYWGAEPGNIVSGLLFSGWDNHAHFTTFANTVASGSTTWPTIDGSIAWNQWYPSLHTTTWALLQYAGSNADLTRIELLQPFVVWTSLTFALCLGALTWLSADIARRWRGGNGAGILAAIGFAVFALLGATQNLYQSGFTNFVLALTVTAVASYISARSWSAARAVGWFLVPLAAVAVIGLWTPLVLGLVPAGGVVVIARWRASRTIGIVYLIAALLAGVFMLLTQSRAILGASDVNLHQFNEIIGAVSTGMAAFNVGAGIIAPLAAALLGFLRWRTRAHPSTASPVGVGVAAPAVGAGVIALYFSVGAAAAGVSPIVSYYVLKALSAAYVMAAPVVIAAIAVLLAAALGALRARWGAPAALAAAGSAGLLTVTAFGYVGAVPVPLAEGFTAAPGIANAAHRAEFVTRATGAPLVKAARTAALTPELTPFLIDDAGTLPNLWTASLTDVLSASQQLFYLNLPPYPYEAPAMADHIAAMRAALPELKLNLLWLYPETVQRVQPGLGSVEPITLTRVIDVSG